MTDNYRWIVLIALSLMAFLINVDYTAVNLALIPMAADLHADINTMQWVLSAYVLVWAVLVIPVGSYADKHSKRHLCLSGLGLFLFASLLAGLASSAHLLIAARILQGIAGAIYVPAMYSLIYINFSENERGRAIGMMSLGVGLGMAMGPFIGGVLLAFINWRSIFFINIPVGLIALLIIYYSPEKEHLKQANNTIDKTSAILLGLSTIIILYVLGQWQLWAQNAVVYFALLIAAVSSFIGFVHLQKRIANPLIPLSIFSNLPFTGVCIGMLLEQYGFSTIIVASGLYLQKIMQFSSLTSSLVYLALTAIFGVIAAMGGSWIDRTGLRKPTVLGLALLAVGSIFFALLSPNSNIFIICLMLIVLGVGMGLAFAGLNTGVVKTVTPEQIGIGSSVFLMCALLGNAFGVTITTLIYQKSSLTKFIQLLLDKGVMVNINQINSLNNYIANIGGLNHDLILFSNNLKITILSNTGYALNYGIHNIMLLNALILLIATLCCAMLFKKK